MSQSTSSSRISADVQLFSTTLVGISTQCLAKCGHCSPADSIEMGTPATDTGRIEMLRMIGRKDFVKDCVPTNTFHALNLQV